MKQKRTVTGWFYGLTAGYLAAMASVYLLFPGLQGYGGIVGDKLLLYWILTGGYLVALLLLLGEGALVGAYTLSPKGYLRSTTWPERFCLLYLLLTWISALASPWFPETLLGVSRHEGALMLSCYCLSFLLVVRWGRAKRWLLWVLAGSLSLCCLLSLLQLTGANPLGLYPDGYTYADGGVHYGGQYLGTIGNVDLLAGLLALGIPMLWVALVRLQGRGRWWLLLPLLLCLTVLVWMHVLAGLVGVFGGALFTLPAVLPVAPKRRKWLWLGAAAVAVLALVAFYLFSWEDGLFREMHLLLHGKAEDEFGSGRLYIWRSVLERLPDKLLLGSGPDTMLYAELDAFTRSDEALGATIVSYIDAAHNAYLNILFHQGIFALASYLLMLFTAAWHWLRYSASDAATAVLGAGVLAYCIQGFFGIEMFLVAPFFWLALALLVGRNRRDANNYERNKRREQTWGKDC